MTHAGGRRGSRLRAIVAWTSVITFSYMVAMYLGALIAVYVGIDTVVGRLLLHSALLVLMLFIATRMPLLVGKPRLTRIDAGLQKMLEWKHIPMGILGFLAYIGIMILVTPILKQIAWFDVAQPQELGLDGMSGGALFVGFIVLVIATPIVEEILFRGILQGKQREAGVAFIPTALIVGALFAAAHGQLNVAVDVFFMSLVASYLRERTGQLWPSIIVHMCKNMFAFYAVFVLGGGL